MKKTEHIQFYYTAINTWDCFRAPHWFSQIQIKNSEREIILRISQPYPISQTCNKQQKKLIRKEIKKITNNTRFKLNYIV